MALRVAVIAWDVGHNPLGRAYLLADMLGSVHDVQIVGASFPLFGTDIWFPLREGDVPIRRFPGLPFPDHLQRMEREARRLDADVILVSKPRLPSYGLGILAKAFRNRPLVLDVDDREVAFFDVAKGCSLEQVERCRADPDFLLPYGRIWTQCCEAVVRLADHVTVSNNTLVGLYGGTPIPHARDESIFNPHRWDREAARRRLGVTDRQRIVLFAGTARQHKGILDVAKALAEIDNPEYRLCLVATPELADLKPALEPYRTWIKLIPSQPFSKLPETLAAADLVCVLQDPASEIAQYQMPAKVTDALAMEVPCLTSRVGPVEPLIRAGLVEPTDPSSLASSIRDALELPDARLRARRGREYFLDQMSYAAVRPTLERILVGAAEDSCPLHADLRAILDYLRSTFPPPTLRHRRLPGDPYVKPSLTRRRTPPKIDAVFFWKQNDSGVYGRRPDMLAKYFARADRVRSVLHFDPPVDVASMRTRLGWGSQPSTDHARLLARETLRRMRGARRDGVIGYSFVYGSPVSTRIGRHLLLEKDEYLGFVASRLAQHGIDVASSVFVVYPTNTDLPRILDVFSPGVVVADVVDDDRVWQPPGSPRRDQLTRNYAEVLSLSDVVLVNCDAMQQTVSKFGTNAFVVPNGCEPQSLSGRVRAPREIRRLPRPIVGYVGNLSSRIDVDLLEELVRRKPEWQLVLIGSTHLGGDIFRLTKWSNVHFLGPKPYEEARRFVRFFDVAIIPHVDDEMTRVMNPMKAYVYCAEGVPVVTTEISGLGDLDDLLRRASGPDDFISEIEAAIRVPHGRSEVLSEHSWPRRVETVLRLVDDVGLQQR